MANAESTPLAEEGEQKRSARRLWEADYNVPASNATALRAIRSLTVVATVNVGAYVSITVFPTNTCSSTPTDSSPNESDQWVLARNFVIWRD